MPVPYTSRSGATLQKPVLGTDVTERDFFDGDKGWCLACGTRADNIEPDARRLVCLHCGERKVYGLDELAVMELVA